MKASTLWLWVFWMLAGCLPSKAALDETASDIAVLAIDARDLQGGSWPLDSVPRALRLELTFDALPAQPEKRIWLVRGPIDPDLREDLLDPPLRKATLDRLIEVAFEKRANAVVLTPMTQLKPGERYAVAVLKTPQELFTQELRVSTSPAAGASFIESLPADQARGVPPNLKSLLLRFDGYLNGKHQVSLRLGSGEIETRTTLLRCSELGLPEGDCLTVMPASKLAPQTSFELELQNLQDANGAELQTLRVSFETGDTEDTQVPSLMALPCAVDERALEEGGCVLEQDEAIALRLTVDEPVFAALVTPERMLAALSFGRSVELTLRDLPPETALPSRLSLTDLAGNTHSFALGLGTVPPLSALSIDEVRCDPLGPEPAQETIELLNFGSEPIQIMGFSVSDDALEPGVRIQDDLTIVPSERILVVGPAFDARDMSDGPLSPGVRLARTDKALSLNNAGAALFLRDKQGRRLSEAPKLKPEKPGACVARVIEDPRSGAAGSFAHDPDQTCTPGRETTWP